MTMSTHQWYRWIMPMFLHSGFLHLMMNLLSQLILGAMMEKVLTLYRTCAIYFLSG